MVTLTKSSPDVTTMRTMSNKKDFIQERSKGSTSVRSYKNSRKDSDAAAAHAAISSNLLITALNTDVVEVLTP